MDKNRERKLIIKNTQGKLLLEKTKLEYSKEILQELEKDPAYIEELLEKLKLNENDFLNKLSGNHTSNITFYDQALVLIKKNNTKKNR